MKQIVIWCIGVLTYVLCSSYALAFDALPASPPHIIKFHNKLTVSELQTRPDTDLVELSNGSLVKLGSIRRFTALAQKNRSTPAGTLAPAALKIKPSKTSGIQVRSQNDLKNAQKLPDTETLILPSGQRLTVGMLKFLLPHIEEQRKHKDPTVEKLPDLSGPTQKVTVTTDWFTILQKSDTTILESPTGKRITVGELKQV